MIIIMIIIFPNTESSENTYSVKKKNKSETDKQQHKHTQGPSEVLHFTRGERNE